MSATLIDGKAISQQLLADVAAKVSQRSTSGKRAPCLAVVLIGSDAASAVYVNNKKKACEKVGIKSLSYEYGHDFTQAQLLALVDELNANDEVDGIWCNCHCQSIWMCSKSLSAFVLIKM